MIGDPQDLRLKSNVDPLERKYDSSTQESESS